MNSNLRKLDQILDEAVRFAGAPADSSRRPNLSVSSAHRDSGAREKLENIIKLIEENRREIP